MKITTDLLKQLDACEKGLKYIQRFYPEGAEMQEIAKDRHISKEFLHWGRQNLQLTQDDIDAYCKACKIINSFDFFESDNLQDSSYINKSSRINSSSRIFLSKNINKSTDVVCGESIENCSQIFASQQIVDSTRVFNSVKVEKSDNVCFSNLINNSFNIFNSTNIKDSTEIFGCSDIKNSHFCSDCNNLQNCLFCKGLSDTEYALFNQSISKEQFDLINHLYKNFKTLKIAFVNNWPKNLERNCYPIVQNKAAWFDSVDLDFWEWVKTLPNFDISFCAN